MNILDPINIAPTNKREQKKSRFSFKEKGKRYTAINPQLKVCHEYHHLDKQEFFHNRPCVDYALYLIEDKILYLIELKGSDIRRAYQQVSSTFDDLNANNCLDNCTTKARIVLKKTRTPALRSNEFKALVKECKQKGLEVISKNTPYQEEI